MIVIEHTDSESRRRFRLEWCLAWERVYGRVPVYGRHS
jgi:hypothetical protein